MLEQAKTVENCFDAYSANPFVLPEGCPVTPEDISGEGRPSVRGGHPSLRRPHHRYGSGLCLIQAMCRITRIIG
ncbi:MAG: hypothetical protein ACI3WQ_02890 [Faecousia sp.]